MTRCKHCNCYNNQLKSSVFNQTGECYELQLAAYNAMTNHLRRVLSAKSVVDSGDIDSAFDSKRIKFIGKTPTRRSERNTIDKESLSQNLINRLTYDTKHHPKQLVKMSLGFSGNYKKLCNRLNETNSSDDSIDSMNNHKLLMYRGEKLHGDRKARNKPSRFRQKRRELGSTHSNEKNKLKTAFVDRELPAMNKFSKSEQNQQRESQILRTIVPCDTLCSEITICPRTPELSRSSAGSSCIMIDPVRSSSNNDISTYVKFVYDITKEIMDRGYYSDDEIERVFENHFQRNLGRLNKKKMLGEIKCLKRALNINCDSDDVEDDEYETGVTSGFMPCSSSLADFQSTSPRLGVTLPKVVQSDLIVDQISPPGDSEPLQVSRNKYRSTACDSIAIDQAEVVVTTQDVLTTLLEMGFDTKKAREICENLQTKSRNPILVQRSKSSGDKDYSIVSDVENHVLSYTRVSDDLKFEVPGPRAKETPLEFEPLEFVDETEEEVVESAE